MDGNDKIPGSIPGVGSFLVSSIYRIYFLGPTHRTLFSRPTYREISEVHNLGSHSFLSLWFNPTGMADLLPNG